MSEAKGAEVADNLRDVLLGKPDSATAVPELVRRCGQKVLAWYELARRYRTEGLPRQILADLWQEWEANRTNVELILQVSANQPAWAKAAHEVKKFMDELSYEITASDGFYRDFLCRKTGWCEPNEQQHKTTKKTAEKTSVEGDIEAELLLKYELPDNECTRAVAAVAEAAVDYVPEEQATDVVALLHRAAELLTDGGEEEAENNWQYWQKQVFGAP